MENESILETIESSFNDLANDAVEYVPNILAALLLIIAGSILARWIVKLLAKLLSVAEANKRVKAATKNVGFDIFSLTNFGLVVLKWAIMLIFYSAAVDVLGIQVLSDTFAALVAYTPKIFAAAMVAGLAILVANVVSDIVKEAAKNARLEAAGSLASASRIIVLVFGFPLAAAQLGLDLTIINNNITVIVAGFMLAFGIAFGMGGRDVAGKIVEDVYKQLKR